MTPEFQSAQRYGIALHGWYAQMFRAHREGQEFDLRRPEPEDFPIVLREVSARALETPMTIEAMAASDSLWGVL